MEESFWHTWLLHQPPPLRFPHLAKFEQSTNYFLLQFALIPFSQNFYFPESFYNSLSNVVASCTNGIQLPLIFAEEALGQTATCIPGRDCRTVLVGSGCHKPPQDFPLVLEAGNQRPNCWQVCVLLRPLRRTHSTGVRSLEAGTDSLWDPPPSCSLFLTVPASAYHTEATVTSPRSLASFPEASRPSPPVFTPSCAALYVGALPSRILAILAMPCLRGVILRHPALGPPASFPNFFCALGG